MSDQFKCLGFVESTATSALDTAGSTYSTARDKTLNVTSYVLETFFNKLEAVMHPVVSFSKDHSHNMLLFVDTTVDKSMSAVHKTAQYSREQATKLVGEKRVKPVENLASDTMATVHTTIYDRIPAAARSVSTTVQDTAKGVYSNVSGIVNGMAQRAMDGLRAADKAAFRTANGMQTRAVKARDSVYSRVVVPVSGYTKNAYLSVRDAITTQPLYAKGYYTTASTLSTLSSTKPAQTAATLFTSKVYPIIEPLAAPLVATGAPYLSAALKEAEPAAEAKRAVDGDDKVADGELTMRKVEQRVKEAPKKARNGKVSAKPVSSNSGPVESTLKDE